MTPRLPGCVPPDSRLVVAIRIYFGRPEKRLSKLVMTRNHLLTAA